MVIVFILYFYYNVHMLDLTGLFLYITLNPKKKKLKTKTERNREGQRVSMNILQFHLPHLSFFFSSFISEIAGRFFYLLIQQESPLIPLR